jgi:hypothetical protein
MASHSNIERETMEHMRVDAAKARIAKLIDATIALAKVKPDDGSPLCKICGRKTHSN